MFSFDDEACIDVGSCSDILPQYFELVDGTVRIRPEFGEAPADRDRASAPSRRSASTRR